MNKILGAISLFLSFICFAVFVGGWIEAIYRLGFRSAVQVTFYSGLGYIVVGGLLAAGIGFLILGLSILNGSNRRQS